MLCVRRPKQAARRTKGAKSPRIRRVADSIDQAWCPLLARMRLKLDGGQYEDHWLKFALRVRPPFASESDPQASDVYRGVSSEPQAAQTIPRGA